MIGAVLGQRFELQGLMVDGPIFGVYFARDVQANRDVCVRLLKPPFASESRFKAALSECVERYRSVTGAQVEAIHRLVDDGDDAFLIGDLTRGPTLQDRIRKLAPFSVPVSVQIAHSICKALEPMHRAGLAHGDIASHNVVLMANDEARLQMAGIWQAYSASGTAGAVVLPGMAPYLAPEVSGGGEPNPSSDVYAVGIILYELLTGRQPYLAETAIATTFQHRDLPTPSVRTINASVPNFLEELVRRAMAKDPADRYANAAEMAADLRALMEALRFGKTLKWPLRPVAGKPAAAVPGPVAPRMSAIRPPEDEQTREKRRTERDVPVWMLVAAAAMGAIVISLLAVWIFFNLSRPRILRVPDIKSLTVSEARSMLDDLNLELRVKSREPNDKVEIDRILDVDPEPGQEVREGGRVYVTVSAGSRFVEVPELTKMTIDKARTVLEGLGLTLDPLTEERPSATIPLGDIVETIPPARARTERGSRIKLVVSSGIVQEPETIGKAFVYSLAVTVRDVVRPVRVRIDINDLRGTRTIYEERRESGDRIEVETKGYGDRATFRIYYDDELVKDFVQSASGAIE